MKIDHLKIVTVILFLVITRNNSEHVVMPMIFSLITSLFYIFSEFKHTIPFVLAIAGLCLVLYTIVKKNKFILIAGYLLTYLILIVNLIDPNTFNNFIKEIYFFLTTTLYLILSIYVILKPNKR